MIPLYGFLEGDTLGLLIFAYPQDKMSDLIAKLQRSAALRVSPRDNMALMYQDRIVELSTTVKELDIQPLEHFFVKKINAS